MKATVENIEKGIANYLDHEFLDQYNADSVRKTFIGVGISLYFRKKSQEIKAMLLGDMGKNMGIVDENGLIDIELLKDTFKSQISENGIVYENPYIGSITFTKDDVDVLYKYIVDVDKGVNV